MIPSVLAETLKQGTKGFLTTTFPIASRFFGNILEDLLESPEGVFKGPWLSVSLPFKQGEGNSFFNNISLKYNPYMHQEKAFERLTGGTPRSTLVATGTGSGKTECFLYPILEYCRSRKPEKGIKAVIIYPMNALATDQALRMAGVIWNNPGLKGEVTAGLYIGQSESEPRQVMSADGVITNKETLRSYPPDILITNYKMLDYLLVRPKDRELWKFNEPETLRYLVVDELHTFSGAQGTDLACLIRRLKSRLETPENFLCCVGTSATLGTKEEMSSLCDYAGSVFGEHFDKNSIITENRMTPGEFLEQNLISFVDIVPFSASAALDPESYKGYEEYIRTQIKLWFDMELTDDEFLQGQWRITLSERLREHMLFHNLLKILGGSVKHYDEIIPEMERVTPRLKNTDVRYRTNLLNSLLAMISEAKMNIKTNGDKKYLPAPFLHVRLQLWLRELRRMVSTVSKTPALLFADDLNEVQLQTCLPLVHCRECGSTGWGALCKKLERTIIANLQDFYIAFFSSDPKVTFLFSEAESSWMEAPREDYYHLCTSCLTLNTEINPKSCKACHNEELVYVYMPKNRHEDKKSGKAYSDKRCPFCETPDSLTILGSRAASLTSVMIGQLFGSGFNNDKKIITFSDSVQDAAHRAGFFSARTYRFSFRTALQKYIQESGSGNTLASLPSGFIEYWRSRKKDDDFIATFIAPNMMWFEDFDYLTQHNALPNKSNLIDDTGKRISWEIFCEYGFSARIGRTLEKTGSSIIHPAPGLMEKMAVQLTEQLKNEIGTFQHLDELTLKRFVTGLVTHLKNKGAIYHPALVRYVEDGGNAWHLSSKFRPWMPAFGSSGRTPSFLTDSAKIRRFDTLLSPSQGHKTWWQVWAEKCFIDKNPMIRSEIDRLYDFVMKALVRHNILEEQIVQNHRIWGLKPESLIVTPEVIQMKCNTCGNYTSAAKPEKDLWEGAPCLRYRCEGSYEPVNNNELDYYGKLYSYGDLKRIFAAEHTGLLTRDEREKLEKEFKKDEQDRHPWTPNLLSCTPTLEMGIDIGDLSSVILCSVPPGQSNYVQRIGRAGRRDGNSLNLTVANARPHDLYFFAEPEEMIGGKVEPPGVFLNASAVLERQFTAFCFDNWVQSGIPAGALPEKLAIVIGNAEKRDDAKFPFNFFRYVENHQTDLLERFIDLFKGILTNESIGHIERFVKGGTNHDGCMSFRIIDGLLTVHREVKSLQSKVSNLNKAIKKNKDNPAKDLKTNAELAEQIREKNALQNLINIIKEKNTFNFLTDEGLIPNYAFPEAGVMLKSIIFRERKDPVDPFDKYDTWTYEYERPAVSAISELAPMNTFYAGGRMVEIDQIDMSLSEIETWRLCNNCSYMELDALGKDRTACPNCGSLFWTDQGQKRDMVRMKQVFANTPDSKSRIADDSDDREPAFYTRQTMVHFEHRNIMDAYKIDSDDLPFGFEFLSKAGFREINFGEKGEFGEKVTVAGIEQIRKGFVICKHCGKVQDKQDKINHAITCTARNQDSEKNLANCVYLYREFTSEAIRILLPVTTFAGSDRKLHSFIAALNLGLKKKFKGNIDHLQITTLDEPVPESSLRKRYLVLFDTVPGGTGYLKQLMRSEKPLMEVIEIALDILRSCPCNQDPEKDGCYKCLYAYRNSYTMDETFRNTAVELMSDILKYRDKLVKTETLSTVNIGSLFDSELETRFIEALNQNKKQNLPVSLKKQLVNNKPGYHLKAGDYSYQIEPQVLIGEGEGVRINVKADFVFYPVRDTANSKPIAVFMDGFTFHKKKISDDIIKRMELLASGRYYVWSLTWKDVDNCFNQVGDYFCNFLNPEKNGNGPKLRKLLDKFDLKQFSDHYKRTSFEKLVAYLANPEPEKWSLYTFLHGMVSLDMANSADPEWLKERCGKARDSLPETIGNRFFADPKMLFGYYNKMLDGKIAAEIWLCAHQESVAKQEIHGVSCILNLQDEPSYIQHSHYMSVWNGALHFFNTMQFLPQFYFLTKEGVDSYGFDAIISKKTSEDESGGMQTGNEEWNNVRSNIDKEYHPVVKLLIEHNITIPEPGYELADEAGEVVATAELAWEAKMIALLCGNDLETKPEFINRGWKTIAIDDVLENSSLFLSLLRQQKEITNDYN